MHLLERLERESGRDYALRTIKDNIIRLQLAPGSQVSENELAAEMGLSRTPVREALIELAKVKVIETTPQKRSVVAPINYELVEQSRFMRHTLECAVVELDCHMATPDDLRRLEENVHIQEFSLEQNYPESLMGLDNHFHKMLFEIAKMSQVHALMETISIHFDRIRNLALNSVKDQNIVQDHVNIVQAIRNRDAQLASTIMKTHLARYQFDVSAIKEKYPQYF